MWLLLVASTLLAQDWKAGAAKVDITPQGPIWMAGYAARTKPSQGVVSPIYAKALAIEDGRKGRVVFVSTDIIGFPRSVAEEIAIAALKKYKLERSQLVLNSSHTHSGPVVWPNLATMYLFSNEEKAKVEAFTRKLVGQVTDVIGAALSNLKPSQVEYDLGEAKFGMNRRKPTPEGIKNSPHPEGPTDHTVPTLRVRDSDQKLVATLFGYSCHNTTMTGEFYDIGGDYAGFAQAEVEAKLPGTIAMFVTACAGDQNPYPRSSKANAVAHGHELAESVIAASKRKGEVLKGRIRSRHQLIDLPFQSFGRNDFEQELKSSNQFAVRRAQAMIAAIDSRNISRDLPYPIQAIQLGQASIVTMGGEVVVDYCLRLRRETGKTKLFVMGYSNDVMCYIPTKKQVEEGGYEANESFLYYGQPAPLKGEIEELIIGKIKALLAKVKP
jgi:neutral ceramidase